MQHQPNIDDLQENIIQGMEDLQALDNPRVGQLLREIGDYWKNAIEAGAKRSPVMAVYEATGYSFTNLALFFSGVPLSSEPEKAYEFVSTIAELCARVTDETCYEKFRNDYDPQLKQALNIDQ